MSTLEQFWTEFHTHTSRAATAGVPILFRGESQAGWPLVPSITRDTKEGTLSNVVALENALLRDFRLAAVPLIEREPESEIEWLFLAQHYGLPTRLLDWSTNPMVALFFAVEKDDDKDAVLHVIDHQVTDQVELIDFRTASVRQDKQQGALGIFAIQQNQGTFMFVRPKYTDRRYLNQRSVFLCPADPFTPPLLTSIRQLHIASGWKPQLRQVLRTFGLVHSFIYPGLEGTAKEIKSMHYDPVASGRAQYISLQMTLDASSLSPHAP